MRTDEDRRRVRLALTHLEVVQRELERTFRRLDGVPGLGWRTATRIDREHDRVRRLHDDLARRLDQAPWRDDGGPR